ncbi:S-methyl-5'-thioadenosine phosphorylase-like [Centruroides sculpturatus]|uniref:S-methyl-5'-thioadenosine phosphorylase-like n=1 Tax=Centruroides sculpturatus TaxID=218467 RepID=UPI000C6E3660|nr:S-methyl-5'-thioadenosine phosphorylase-like [Centruroides sculpturatus]
MLVTTLKSCELHKLIGIIGGSGLDDPDIINNRKELHITTPFGNPSDVLIEGKIKDVDCVLLARHARNHSIMPSNINYRANIWALKEVNCTHILATSACGSLREEIHPGDLVFPDQFIDRTTKRASTFYDGSPSSPLGVCHIPMHMPFCSDTRKVVVLAREIGIPYALIAMATDYDCWYSRSEAVSVEKVLSVLQGNVHKTTKLILNVIPKINKDDWSEILEKLKNEASSAVMVPKK